MHKIACLFSLLSATTALGQMPQQMINAERAKILDGVTSVPKAGTPGPIGIWGNIAFPILSASSGRDGNEMAVAAAAAYGKGRVILFGQNAYLNGGSGGDSAKLLTNCVRWVGSKEKPRLLIKGVQQAGFFDLQGFKTEKLDGPIDKGALSRCDVLILNAQNVTDPEEGAALIDWIKNGGGLIAGMTGWAYSQTSGGKELATTHGVNQALLPAGIAFTDMSAFDQLPAFQARAELPRFMNASEAITAIKAQRTGGPALTPEETKQGTSAIQIALAAQPPGRNNLQAAVASAMGGNVASAIPSQDAPLTQDQHASARIQLGMETRMLRLTHTETIPAHPASAKFPGQPAADAPRATQEITIDPKIPGWTSTGLYATAGETLTITLPAALAEKGFALRIGCHSDTLYHLDKWLRAPDITKSQPLSTPETKAASAFGGLIYIEVPSRTTETAPFTVTIAGGVPAPLFILGKTTDEEWNSRIKKNPAPWAEFACDKVILSAPSDAARTVNNPTQLMEFWKKVVEAQDDISNQTAERKRPERIVADVQISAGYMHSGYPIMVPTSTALEMVTFNKLKFPGWGFYHELGHNHQRGDFTFDGTGEVTNNVLGMYCYEAVLGKDWLIGHPAISEASRKEHIAAIKKASNKWQEWKGNPFTALTTYIQLIQEFGWPSWRSYLYSFSDPAFGPAPANDDDKRDQFLIRYSKITNKNLGPFFEAWGIPVSSAAKTAVEKLEPWMPKGM